MSVISAVVSGTASAVEQVADRRLGRLEVLAPDGPDVDLELAALGDDVGTGAAGDDADVERDARPAAVQRVDPL